MAALIGDAVCLAVVLNGRIEPVLGLGVLRVEGLGHGPPMDGLPEKVRVLP